MATPDITTGDDVALLVTLKKNGATFTIDPGATVEAAIVDAQRITQLMPAVSQSNGGNADWANSLVEVILTSAQTAVIDKQGGALLEIQVDDSGKQTWFASVNIKRGSIA